MKEEGWWEREGGSGKRDRHIEQCGSEGVYPSCAKPLNIHIESISFGVCTDIPLHAHYQSYIPT